MKGSLRILLVLAAIVALVAMSGCAGIVEKAVTSGVESATGVKVDTGGNSVSIEGKDGNSLNVSSDGELPEGFPADMPIYDGAKVTTAIASEGDKGKGFMVGLGTGDSAGTVFDWYDKELKAEGWTVKTTMKTEDGGLLGGEKGTTTFTVAIGPGSGDEAKTTITISIAPK
jgi:hypothetical protein